MTVSVTGGTRYGELAAGVAQPGLRAAQHRLAAAHLRRRGHRDRHPRVRRRERDPVDRRRRARGRAGRRHVGDRGRDDPALGGHGRRPRHVRRDHPGGAGDRADLPGAPGRLRRRAVGRRAGGVRRDHGGRLQREPVGRLGTPVLAQIWQKTRVGDEPPAPAPVAARGPVVRRRRRTRRDRAQSPRGPGRAVVGAPAALPARRTAVSGRRRAADRVLRRPPGRRRRPPRPARDGRADLPAPARRGDPHRRGGRPVAQPRVRARQRSIGFTWRETPRTGPRPDRRRRGRARRVRAPPALGQAAPAVGHRSRAALPPAARRPRPRPAPRSDREVRRRLC